MKLMAALSQLLLLVLLVGCAPNSPGVSQAADVDSAPSKHDFGKPAAGIGEVDYGCESDAQCTVKDVGSCCGYSPACVNVDSPTFPEQVRADCAASGLSGICGFADISACQCVDQRCEAKSAASVVLRQD